MTGMITLIGAGPGDCELLTIKGLRKLREADVVVYDRLVNRELLSEAKAESELIYVGKEPQYHPVPQREITEILIAKARSGKKVVRLKGGDPYVFGRGGEEGRALLEAGIPFDVVPGITSAIGGLAYGGIPITYRELAGAFHVITAHRSEKGLELDWQTISKLSGTLVFLMGLSELETICHELQRNGISADKPAAVIHWATRYRQQTVEGTLSTLVEQVVAAGITSPSLIVVGDVVKMRKSLNVFENRSLFGQQLLIPKGAERLQAMLSDEGAACVSFKRRRLVPIEWELPTTLPAHLVFTNPLSWQSFLMNWLQAGRDIRSLTSEVSGVGHHTCQEIEKSGIQLKHKVQDEADLPVDKNQLVFKAGADSGEQIIVTHTSCYDHPYQAELEDVTGICLPHSKAAHDLLAHYQVSELHELPIFVMGNQTAEVLQARGLKPFVSKEASFASLLTTIETVVNGE